VIPLLPCEGEEYAPTKKTDEQGSPLTALALEFRERFVVTDTCDRKVELSDIFSFLESSFED
jgi:hypothetical protein